MNEIGMDVGKSKWSLKRVVGIWMYSYLWYDDMMIYVYLGIWGYKQVQYVIHKVYSNRAPEMERRNEGEIESSVVAFM